MEQLIEHWQQAKFEVVSTDRRYQKQDLATQIRKPFLPMLELIYKFKMESRKARYTFNKNYFAGTQLGLYL